MQQILEEATDNFHSLLTHDFNIDCVSEIIAARYIKNATDIRIVHPKHMSNYSVKINEKINTMCVARTSLERGFELITGDMKGVVRINSRNGRPFFSKDIRDGIYLTQEEYRLKKLQERAVEIDKRVKEGEEVLKTFENLSDNEKIAIDHTLEKKAIDGKDGKLRY